MWEYKVEYIMHSLLAHEQQEILVRIGKYGWELVSVYKSYFYFKRFRAKDPT